jgi:hypothetical protein
MSLWITLDVRVVLKRPPSRTCGLFLFHTVSDLTKKSGREEASRV